MKPKHIRIRIEQCLSLATASSCQGTHRGFGAMLLDPERNVILMDGYNGPPRGGGKLCGGAFCLRDGITREQFRIEDGWAHEYQEYGGSKQTKVLRIYIGDDEVHRISFGWYEGREMSEYVKERGYADAEEWIQKVIDKNPKCASGTRWEVGCYHAEMNCILNAAAQGVACKGMWMLVTGEPCTLCAKLIYQAGIKKVICIENGWTHANGVEFLVDHGVKVEKTPHPHPKAGLLLDDDEES